MIVAAMIASLIKKFAVVACGSIGGFDVSRASIGTTVHAGMREFSIDAATAIAKPPLCEILSANPENRGRPDESGSTSSSGNGIAESCTLHLRSASFAANIPVSVSTGDGLDWAYEISRKEKIAVTSSEIFRSVAAPSGKSSLTDCMSTPMCRLSADPSKRCCRGGAAAATGGVLEAPALA